MNKYPYDTIYQNYNDPADYIATSINLGINNELVYHLRLSDKKQLINQAIGLRNEFYFLERFNHRFETTDNTKYSDNGAFANKINEPYPNSLYGNKLINISNTNLSAFYQIRWFPHDAFSLGARISAGANLYSSWDKFKKYGWLSVGLEMGFLAKKNRKSESQPTD
jgi:hypothetical protein